MKKCTMLLLALIALALLTVLAACRQTGASFRLAVYHR